MNNTLSHPQDAFPSTIEHHQQFQEDLDFTDKRDFDTASKGFIATLPDAKILDAQGKVVWDLSPYTFLEEENAPFTANPSLWRHARLNMHHGLFEVVEGIYQVRGFDLANITFIESKNGVIIIDPLTFEESARVALQLYREHRGDRPVIAVIYSHSHRDHYGGVRGVVDPEDVKAGRVPVIAPDGFMEEVVAEEILAGVPMRRRALYQFGTSLQPGPQSQIDSGLSKGVGRGTFSVIPPTQLIVKPTEEHEIDGVQIIFQLTPGTEAPAEMNFYFPQHRALNLAENACRTMHNLCPLRGAKTRDSLAWARYLDEALEHYAPHSDVVFAQHHWPTWGNAEVTEFIRVQRDLYRFLHDQTLRLMSHGLTPREIADELMLPNEISRNWHARGYYGAVAHNVAAIYAHYMGPYDGNPVSLNPLTPVAAGKKYVEYMGGIPAVLDRARKDLENGEFRWVAEVMSHVVFADPDCQEARFIEAAALEQLGYQSESATWRNAYLLGAYELRNGVDSQAPTGATLSPQMMAIVPMSRFLDTLAIRLDGLKAQDINANIDWVTAEEDSCHKLMFSNGAMSHLPGTHGSNAQAQIHISRPQLAALLKEPKGFYHAAKNGDLKISGDTELVIRIFSLFDDFSGQFNIMEP